MEQVDEMEQVYEMEQVDEMEQVEEMKLAEDFEALQAAETEVAAHMDAVIKRAKDADGWEVDDVLRKVNVGVSKILDDHAIGDATKEKAMDHLDNKLSTMLEEISAEKEAAYKYNPCRFKKEGAACKVCPPWRRDCVETTVLKSCQKGKCEMGRSVEMEQVEEMKLAEEMKPAEDFEALQAAETEVAAHMDAVIERAIADDGWEIEDVLSKVNA